MEKGVDDLATIKRDAKRNVIVVLGLVASLWLVAVINVAASGYLLRFGVTPRTTHGLIGIPLHPFLHVGLLHLLLNSVGLVLLGGLVMMREERDFWVASILGTFVAGLGIWLVGRHGVHVGASTVVFAYFGYLLATGWYDRRVGAILLSLSVFVLWGSLLFGMLPTQVAVSWEGHVFGFIGGVFTAWLRGYRLRTAGGLTSA
jgi:membrane associated rhomboid family serine protease